MSGRNAQKVDRETFFSAADTAGRNSAASRRIYPSNTPRRLASSILVTVRLAERDFLPKAAQTKTLPDPQRDASNMPTTSGERGRRKELSTKERHLNWKKGRRKNFMMRKLRKMASTSIIVAANDQKNMFVKKNHQGDRNKVQAVLIE